MTTRAYSTISSAAVFRDPLDELLEGLDKRSQDIVSRRFGLESGNEETLESIGRQYGITRERVRQIEVHAMRLLQDRLTVLENVSGYLSTIFQAHGGILPLHKIVDVVRLQTAADIMPTLVSFYLELLPPYNYHAKDPVFIAHWRQPELVPAHAGKIVEIGRLILSETKQPIEEASFINAVRRRVSDIGSGLPDEHIYMWLAASRHITKDPFGEWGLVGWAEMTPRGVGDKAYAVLRRHGKPEHFRNIAQMINAARFDRKTANPQTVHNELIKDERFVLVGRGLYGLTQWGYVPGTVADVVAAVLREAKEPLGREEIIQRVLEQRLVKKNTVVLSLQNQSRFVKVAENRYTLSKKS